MSGFTMFERIKKKIYQENFTARVKLIEKEEDRCKIEEMQKEIESQESKYSS
jgi:hypothetical protein